MASNSQLAKIHIAKKDLGLNEAEYGALLYGATKKHSAKNLSEAEAEKVLAEFKRLGWGGKKGDLRPDTGNGNKSGTSSFKIEWGKFYARYKNLGDRDGDWASYKQVKYLFALWLNSKLVRVKTLAALNSFINNKYKVSDLRFLDQDDVQKVVNAIKYFTH